MNKAFYKDLVLETSESVYEPREDSFLLAEQVEKHARGEVLDLGTGSGLQAILASRSGQVTNVLAVDVNEDALRNAENNLSNAKGVLHPVKFRKTDLFSMIGEKFDCIIFNPPYLPTNTDEKVSGELNKALDGGVDGRTVLRKFLKFFHMHLKKNGCLLLLSSSLNDNDWVQRELESKGFKVAVLSEQNIFFEKLVVFKAER
ncbi:methyltransferase [Candidatus Micrarchaeota archaeon]|nr:methyltransferase [Candidatus Micrarchaeota archaeon]